MNVRQLILFSFLVTIICSSCASTKSRSVSPDVLSDKVTVRVSRLRGSGGSASGADYSIDIRKWIRDWQLIVNRGTDPKRPLRVVLPKDEAVALQKEALSFLYGYRIDPSPVYDDERSGNTIALEAFHGSSWLTCYVYRGKAHKKAPKLEEFLSKLNKHLPSQYQFD